MKQDKRPAGAAVKKRRFFNRISRKLMLFVVLMSMVLLALVWLLSVKLLEPMYNRRVLADLNHAADVYSAIIEKYGKFESFDKSGGVHIPSDMMEEIMDNRGLLAGKCFEVAGTDCKVLLHLHQLQSDQCLLHPNPLSQLMEYSEPQWNSTAAVNLRATTFVLGDLNFTLPDSRILPGLESTSGTRQMVVCPQHQQPVFSHPLHRPGACGPGRRRHQCANAHHCRRAAHRQYCGCLCIQPLVHKTHLGHFPRRAGDGTRQLQGARHAPGG